MRATVQSGREPVATQAACTAAPRATYSPGSGTTTRNALTPAALWEITRSCERALDTYEGFPHLYIKERLPIALPNGRRAKPMAYVMSGPRQRDYGPASNGYLASIADGYRDFGFDDLAPLRAAQVDAISAMRRAERSGRLDEAALSPPWAPGLAFGCE